MASVHDFIDKSTKTLLYWLLIMFDSISASSLWKIQINEIQENFKNFTYYRQFLLIFSRCTIQDVLNFYSSLEILEYENSSFKKAASVHTRLPDWWFCHLKVVQVKEKFYSSRYPRASPTTWNDETVAYPSMECFFSFWKICKSR